MEKGFSLFIVFILSLSIISASDVAYVLKNPEKPDYVILDIFNEMNLSVDLIDSKNIPGFNFSKYDFIFVGDDRIKNSKYLSGFPIVIANGYYGKDFGISRKNSIKKIAANSPLNIIKNKSLMQVYDTAKFKSRGVNLAYYYISEKYQNNLVSVASVELGFDSETGNVIAYSYGETKKCFFGIIETKYWTKDAEELFKDCVNFVREGNGQLPSPVCGNGILESGEQCDDGNLINGDGCNNLCRIEQNQSQQNETLIHNIGIDELYSNSVNGIRIKNVEIGEYVLGENAELMCGKKYTFDFRTRNLGNFIENISFLGILGEFNWTAEKIDLIPGETTTAGSKTINMTFSEGNYSVNVFANMENDVNLSNNHAVRNIRIVCGVQNQSQQNQTQNNQTGIHDVGIDANYSNSVNGIRIKDLENNNSYLLGELSELQCNKKYTVSYKTINYGIFSENITFTGMIANYSWTTLKNNLESGDDTIAGSKTINMTFIPGIYNLNISANILEDSNLLDNFVSRNVKVVC